MSAISKKYFRNSKNKEEQIDVANAAMRAMEDYHVARMKNAAYKANCWSMWLMAQGRAWRPEEQRNADKLNISLITYNVSEHFIKQKRALIINSETPVDFEVEKEGVTGAEEASKARTILSYCFAKSMGNIKLENACYGYLVTGQHLLVAAPVYEDGGFYMRIDEYPHYRYVPLSRSNYQYWEDITGVAVIDILPISYVMAQFGLTEEEGHDLYLNRYTAGDVFGLSSLSTDKYRSMNYASGYFGQINNLMSDERIKEYVAASDYGLDFVTAHRQNYLKIADIPVLTIIERELSPRKVIRLQRTSKKYKMPEEGADVQTYMSENPPPKLNYIIRDYFAETLKRKNPLYKDMLEDEKNGYLTIQEVDMYCFKRCSYYGKYMYTEDIYPTEVPPYVPVTKEFTNDQFSRGDMDAIYDIQRAYNERMVRINNLMKQKSLGNKTIFNGMIRDNNPNIDTELGEVYASEKMYGFLDIPPMVTEPIVANLSTDIDPEFIRNTYQMPQQMMDILGLTPYVLGAGTSTTRTTTDAQNKANFGTATIKADAMRFYSAVAVLGKRMLTYIKMFAPPNMKITSVVAGKETTAMFNSVEINPFTLRPQVINQLDFDSALLRVMFRGSDFGKDSVFEQKILKLLNVLPQNDPLRAELAEQLVAIQNDDRLMVALQRVMEQREPLAQVEKLQEQLSYMIQENKKQSTQIVNLKEQLAVTKQVASSLNLIRRNAVNMISTIRSLVANLKAESKVEAEKIKLEAERAMAEFEKYDTESDMVAAAINRIDQPTDLTQPLPTVAPNLNAQQSTPPPSPSLGDLMSPQVEDEPEIPLQQ